MASLRPSGRASVLLGFVLSSLALVVLPGGVTPAAAAIVPPPVASTAFTIVVGLDTLVLTKTVGLDPSVCAPSDLITVTGGGVVTYCYRVTNAGFITETLTDLVDDKLGTIFSGGDDVAPGDSRTFTRTAIVSQTTTNTAIVGTGGPTPTPVYTDFATVTVVPFPPPSLVFTKTVSTDDNPCSGSSQASMLGGGPVQYCYQITNTGPLTATLTQLVDDKLGTIFSTPRAVGPGLTVMYTAGTNLTGTTTNTAVVSASYFTSTTPFTSTAFVDVTPANPSIVLTKTVGTDPSTCAAAGTITVTNQATVYYCYQVTNTGNITLTTHDLVDDKLGQLLSGWTHTLGPGETTYVTFAADLHESVTNTATWTAGLVGGASANAGGQAAVDFDYINVPAMSHSGLALLLLVVAAAGLVILRRAA